MINEFLIIAMTLSSFYENGQATANLCEKPDCEASIKPLGCFKDKKISRALPYYIYNERDSTINNHGGRDIDWENWHTYLAGFVCRCANKAKELGYDLFGVQFYGECHAGYSSVHHYDKHGSGEDKDCVGADLNDCNQRKFCAGKGLRNMVYKIVDLCSVNVRRIGCFNDRREQPRLLPSLILSDRDAQLREPPFSGQLIEWQNWCEHLPDFVCRCAQKAQEHGWNVIGVQFWGECWSGPDGEYSFSLEGDAPTGECADQCFNDCSCTVKYCAGKNFTNAVYFIGSAEGSGGGSAEGSGERESVSFVY